MKPYKILLLISFIFGAFLQQAISQETNVNKGTINVGFETGIQFTGITDPYFQISNTGTGFAAGGFVDYYMTDLIKLRGGLYFDNRAFSLSDAGSLNDTSHIARSSYYDVTLKYKVNYLTISISIIYIKGSEKFKFFLQGTLYYSLYLNSTQSGDLHIFVSEEDAPYYTFRPEFNIPGDHYFAVPDYAFSPSDIGINLLVGITYNVKPNIGISFSPGFTYSFTNVWEDPLRTTTWTRIYKINVGIIYTFKQK